jgi:protein-S-isoprenylcysteine O-methyltransferase Ste14
LSERKPLLPPVYLLAAVIGMVALHLILPIARIVPPPWSWGGGILLLGGGGAVLWTARLFRRAGTTLRPFEESTSLLREGPYRYTRNPIYLSMTIGLVGLAIFLGSLSPFAVVPLFVWIIDRRFIRVEERFLEKAFGAAYDDYRTRVRRWL